MPQEPAFFEIKLEGPDIRPSRIRLDDLVKLGQEMLRAVERVALVLQGSADSQRAGRRPEDIRASISLDLVQITHGSPSAVLRFDRSVAQHSIPDTDIGRMAFEKFVQGLECLAAANDALPPGFDPGVLLAVRDVGRLLDRGVDCMEFSLPGGHKPLRSTYTREVYTHVQQRIVGPQINQRTIEGRLLMADFKERGSRLRVHPSSGEPVICLFDDALRDEVYRNILHFVRITGQAKEDRQANRIVSILISDIERIEAKEDQVTDMLPSGAPLPGDFWQAMSFEELAASQDVKPLIHIDALAGTWPGDVDDDFEDAIHKLRQSNLRTV